MTTALEGGEGSASRPGRSLPPGKTRYPLYRRLGGPQGRSGQARKISPPTRIDPRTVQPVASRYTDNATRPMHLHGQPLYHEDERNDPLRNVGNHSPNEKASCARRREYMTLTWLDGFQSWIIHLPDVRGQEETNTANGPANVLNVIFLLIKHIK